MRKIKILQIIGDSTLSGAPICLLNLVKKLDKKKFDITCICPPGPLAGMLKDIEGIKIEVVSMKSKWDTKAIKKIRKLISLAKKENSKLIVHAHGVRGGFLGRLSSVFPKNKAPKVIYTEHLWTKEYRLKNPFSNIIQIYGLWVLDFFTDKTIAVSKAVAEFLVKKGITRKEKVVVIYNGSDKPLQGSHQRRGSEYQAKSKEITIGFVGSLVKRKGVSELIIAFSDLISLNKFQNVKLVIVGEGIEKSKLEVLARDLKIDNYVKFIGQKNDLSDIYQTFDCYVQPSFDEAFGIATLEAMSFGKPIIASSVGGLKELLGTKSHKLGKKPYLLTKYGLVVSPGNVPALTKAMERLIKDSKLRTKLGREAKLRSQEFSLSNTVKETEKLYQSIIS
ncbi:MAG: glycosyltransferase family 4 protein [Candidatus Berkelbacteria bacterium]|nr:glycosyltransferase family 4 protein [Candidatus Berkelbacteria bacterium]